MVKAAGTDVVFATGLLMPKDGGSVNVYESDGITLVGEFAIRNHYE